MLLEIVQGWTGNTSSLLQEPHGRLRPCAGRSTLSLVDAMPVHYLKRPSPTASGTFPTLVHRWHPHAHRSFGDSQMSGDVTSTSPDFRRVGQFQHHSTPPDHQPRPSAASFPAISSAICVGNQRVRSRIHHQWGANCPNAHTQAAHVDAISPIGPRPKPMCRVGLICVNSQRPRRTLRIP
jgi:hypothetical protein